MLSATTTLDRLSYFLSFSDCVINCEDELYIGAALGCAIGIMRSHYGKDLFRMNTKLDEIAAAVRWQSFAPPFSGGELKVSDEILFDSVFFTEKDTWYEKIMNTEVKQAAPAVMARNTDLPTVICTSEKAPFVIASMNPSGAYSIAAIKRRKYLFDTDAPTVFCKISSAERVAVFGDFENIKLSFDKIPTAIYAESLIYGYEEKLELHSLSDKNTVNISADVLARFSNVTDNSDNAVMFRFEF